MLGLFRLSGHQGHSFNARHCVEMYCEKRGDKAELSRAVCTFMLRQSELSLPLFVKIGPNFCARAVGVREVGASANFAPLDCHVAGLWRFALLGSRGPRPVPITDQNDTKAPYTTAAYITQALLLLIYMTHA